MAPDNDATEEFAQPTGQAETAVENTLAVPQVATGEYHPASPLAQSTAPARESRKMLIASFVLGIVGTSLAVIALVVAVVGVSHGNGGGRSHGRASFSVSEDVITERGSERSTGSGHGRSSGRGADGQLEIREFTEEMTGPLNGTMERGHGMILEERIEDRAQ